MLLTADSHNPPAEGQQGAFLCQVMSRSLILLKKSALRFCSISLYSCFNKRSAPMKFVPLSLYICLGTPRRAQNRRNAAKNVGVLKSDTSSRCMAFVERHTKTAMYPLHVFTPRPLLILSSTNPVKSTPV